MLARTINLKLTRCDGQFFYRVRWIYFVSSRWGFLFVCSNIGKRWIINYIIVIVAILLCHCECYQDRRLCFVWAFWYICHKFFKWIIGIFLWSDGLFCLIKCRCRFAKGIYVRRTYMWLGGLWYLRRWDLSLEWCFLNVVYLPVYLGGSNVFVVFVNWIVGIFKNNFIVL